MTVTLLVAMLAAALAWLSPPALAQALQPIPPLRGPVTDTTGTLEAAQVAELDALLRALRERKGAQVSILMVPTTAPEAIEAYSLRAAEAWRLGRDQVDGKAVDDGVLVVVAKDDRRVRIEVGYGLEGAIPDAVARRIIGESIAPRFRSQDWAGGLRAAIADLTARIDGEPLPPAWEGARPEDEGRDIGALLPTLLFAFVGGAILSQVLGRFLGAAAGGIGGGVLGFVTSGSLLTAGGIAVAAFVLVLLLGGGGGGGGGPPMRRVGRRTYRDRSGPIFLPGPFGGGGFGGGGGGLGGGWSGGGGRFGGGGASGGW